MLRRMRKPCNGQKNQKQKFRHKNRSYDQISKLENRRPLALSMANGISTPQTITLARLPSTRS